MERLSTYFCNANVAFYKFESHLALEGHATNLGNAYVGPCKWMSIQHCLTWLLDVKPSCGRVGPLVVVGLLNDSMQSTKWKVPPTLCYQRANRLLGVGHAGGGRTAVVVVCTKV
ncbi:hypothetical protein CK203_011790 [Vitis vinifera]|uniref:Uncharacterized protein n=1 Tax=Vitis vinifera TaxID=29760 RepID=A0A438JUT8_VITVI|nr:hypothetical protein CK203_011790 [Vitis vinifera]